MLTFTYSNFLIRMTELKADMAHDLEGNPFRGIADLGVQSIQMQWGWGVLVSGAVLLLIAAAMRDAFAASKLARRWNQPFHSLPPAEFDR